MTPEEVAQVIDATNAKLREIQSRLDSLACEVIEQHEGWSA